MAQFLSKWYGMLLVSCFLAAVILFPALSGKRVLGTDALELVIPQLAFYKDAFLKGESPFWNPYMAVGFPNFISVGGSPLAPLNLLLFFFSPVTMHYWGIFISLSLALFFFMLFLKELGIGIWGSLIAALGYLAGNIHFARDLVLATALLVQPVLFWVIIKIHKNHGLKKLSFYVLLGSLTIGYAWLMASYFPMLYISTAIFAFIIFLVLKNGHRKRQLLKLLTAFFIILLLGTVIGALQLVPTYVITRFSQRSEGFDPAAAPGYTLGIKELLNFFHPTADRGLDAYLYIGVVPLLFFFFSFLSKNSFAKFFLWIFFVCLIISVKYSPLFWLIIRLPAFKFFQGAARFMLIGIFAASVSAGFGSEYLLEILKRDKIRVASRFLKYFVIAIGYFLLLVIPVWHNRAESKLVFLSALFLISIYFSFKYFLNKPQTLLSILTLIAFIDFTFTFYNFHRFPAMSDMKRSVYEDKPKTLNFLKQQPGRILPLFVDDWDDLYFQNFTTEGKPSDKSYEFLIWQQTYRPNLQFLHQVENLEANEPLLNVDMGRLMALLGTRQLVTAGGEKKLDKLYVEQDGQDISVLEKFKLLKERLPLARFLGIKYFLTGIAFDNPYLYSPIQLPLIEYSTLQLSDDPKAPELVMEVYLNSDSMPLAYFAAVEKFMADNEEIYQAFKESNFEKIFVQCGNCPQRSFSAEGNVFLGSKENGKIELITESSDEQLLVLTQNYLPGWKAFLNNERIQIFKINTVFMGIFVPAGRHNIRFEYDYWSLFNPDLLFGNKYVGLSQELR